MKVLNYMCKYIFFNTIGTKLLQDLFEETLVGRPKAVHIHLGFWNSKTVDQFYFAHLDTIFCQDISNL